MQTNNMNQYLVEINLPEILDQEFLSKIPAQRELISELMQSGVVLVYCLSENQKNAWVCIRAKNIKEVRKIINTFPIALYLQITIFPLTFLNVANQGINLLSLN